MDGCGLGSIAFCGKEGYGLGKPTTLAKEGWSFKLSEGWDD